MNYIVGDALDLSFRKDVWHGDEPLYRRFPLIFDISQWKDGATIDMSMENV